MLFELGKQIRQERKHLNLSQADFAKLFGMSRTTIGQIENGTVPEVGIRKIIRILEYFGLELIVRKSGPPTLEEIQAENRSDGIY
ncbi:MAG: helix-turn-helix domain-containing protein [Thermodesulfobacteriota bacterium]|nr:helix-turn-helix domain-containing protein [Thermodesulfobacteriota bacterium]